jgi:thioester reductase-like protein
VGTGACNADDLVTRLLVGCIQLQRAPLLQHASIEFGAPVDRVAPSIVALGLDAHRTSSYGHAYHEFESTPVSYGTLLTALVLDYGLTTITSQEWLDDLRRSPGNAVFPLVRELEQNLFAASDVQVACDNSMTMGALSKLGHHWETTSDHVHARKQLDFLRRRRILPPLVRGFFEDRAGHLRERV